MPDSIFELSYAGIPSTTTTCTRINDRNLGCPVPVVSKSDWDANRGQNNQMTVSLSLDVGLRSFTTYEGFTIYGKTANIVGDALLMHSFRLFYVRSRMYFVLSASTISVTVWLNGINYAPYSVLSFTYFSKSYPRWQFVANSLTACATTADTVCSSSCTSQQYCGWCPSTLTCAAPSLCSAIDDMFLSQCLGKQKQSFFQRIS